MDQFDTIKARFTPKRTDDLQPEARAAVGEVFEWEASWIIEDGPYLGQWAMVPWRSEQPIGWAPECDLERINEGNDLSNLRTITEL